MATGQKGAQSTVPTSEQPTINQDDASAKAPFRKLTLIFCAWKALLLSLAAFCPGPGYDTSGLVVFNTTLQRHQGFDLLSRFNRLTLNLFRWDAFYFVKSAERGYVFEQEWAFSGTYSDFLRAMVHCKRCHPLSPEMSKFSIDELQMYPVLRNRRCSTILWPGSSFPPCPTTYPSLYSIIS